MNCIHYRRAERELNSYTQALLREVSPYRRSVIRRARIEQAKKMEQHRNCNCQEAA